MTAFFASQSVQTALLASATVAALSAGIGYFVVLRGLAFAGHALTDIGLTGGAAALLLGVSPLAGLLAFSLFAAAGIAALGERARERDVATGLVLAFALGLGAVFLHLQTQLADSQTALLFGSVFDLDSGVLRAVAAIALAALAALGAMYRPLLFASVAPEAAATAGVAVRALGIAFLLVMAVAVAETAQIVGVLIGTALLVGPAGSAIALVRDPLRGIACAMLLGIGEAWVAIVLAYASFGWTHGTRSWPVSFFVAVIALGVYVSARAFRSRTA